MLSENQSIQFNPNFTQPTIISLDNNNDKNLYSILDKLFDTQKKTPTKDILEINSVLPFKINDKPVTMQCKRPLCNRNLSTYSSKPEMPTHNPFASEFPKVSKCSKSLYEPPIPKLPKMSKCSKMSNPFTDVFKMEVNELHPNDIKIPKINKDINTYTYNPSKSNLVNTSTNIQYETIIIFFLSFIILFLLAPNISVLRYEDKVNNRYRPNIFRIILVSLVISVFFLMQSSVLLLENII